MYREIVTGNSHCRVPMESTILFKMYVQDLMLSPGSPVDRKIAPSWCLALPLFTVASVVYACPARKSRSWKKSFGTPSEAEKWCVYLRAFPSGCACLRVTAVQSSSFSDPCESRRCTYAWYMHYHPYNISPVGDLRLLLRDTLNCRAFCVHGLSTRHFLLGALLIKSNVESTRKRRSRTCLISHNPVIHRTHCIRRWHHIKGTVSRPHVRGSRYVIRSDSWCSFRILTNIACVALFFTFGTVGRTRCKVALRV